MKKHLKKATKLSVPSKKTEGDFLGVAVQVRRPTDYNPSLAATLCFLGFAASAIDGTEGLHRIFVGGLPYYFTDR